MIEFRQKCFSEYDAMKTLWNYIQRDFNWRNKVKRCDQSALIPILKGNNVVIERFVISKTFFGKDRYRLYLKLGAKVKLPKGGVRLPGKDVSTKLLNGLQVGIEGGGISPTFQKYDIPDGRNYSNTTEVERIKLFADKKKGGGGGDNGGGGKQLIKASYKPYIDFSRETTISPDTLKFDIKERVLILEFSNIKEAMEALDSLPFGLDYNIYILG